MLKILKILVLLAISCSRSSDSLARMPIAAVCEEPPEEHEGYELVACAHHTDDVCCRYRGDYCTVVVCAANCGPWEIVEKLCR